MGIFLPSFIFVASIFADRLAESLFYAPHRGKMGHRVTRSGLKPGDGMDTQILTTKLYIPPVRPGLVPRPRLLQRLDEGLRPGHRLTLVSAPAGYGKTTLLSEWIHTSGAHRGCAPTSRLALAGKRRQ
jgi:hypothetical protein